MSEVQRVIGPRQVAEYIACPCCSYWSIGVQANGRIVRHSVGWGSVERPRNPMFVPAPICPASGKLKDFRPAQPGREAPVVTSVERATERICSVCGRSLPLEQFPPEAGRNLGRKYQCFDCERERQRKSFHKRFARGHRYKRDPKKKSAQEAFHTALRNGTVQRPQRCQDCGKLELRLHGHHADYDKPLQVEWLCSRCHGRRHAKPVGAPLTDRQRGILEYLKGKDWTYPLEIGRSVWGDAHGSTSPSHICRQLVAMGLLEHAGRKYRLAPPPQPAPACVILAETFCPVCKKQLTGAGSCFCDCKPAPEQGKFTAEDAWHAMTGE